jgi:hypothetical protein
MFQQVSIKRPTRDLSPNPGRSGFARHRLKIPSGSPTRAPEFPLRLPARPRHRLADGSGGRSDAPASRATAVWRAEPSPATDPFSITGRPRMRTSSVTRRYMNSTKCSLPHCKSYSRIHAHPPRRAQQPFIKQAVRELVAEADDESRATRKIELCATGAEVA